MYKLLGENYKNRYDDKSMRIVYLEALEKYPLSGYSPFFYAEIINSYESEGAYAQANKVRDQFLTLVTKDNQWWDKNEYVRESVFKTEELLEEHLLKSARYFASGRLPRVRFHHRGEARTEALAL